MPRENQWGLCGARRAPIVTVALTCLLLLGMISADGVRASGVIAGVSAATSGQAALLPGAGSPTARPVSPATAPRTDSRGWTRQEMLEAKPAGNQVAGSAAELPGIGSGATVSGSPMPAETITDPSLPGFRTNGKLFLKLGPGPDNTYSCSGTVVQSQRRNVVFTAGHCVFDRPAEGQPGVWATDLVFVPAYSNGTGPFGQFPVADMVTTKGWMEQQRQSFDLAVLSLKDRAQDVVGARRIEFGAELRNRSVAIYGYPNEPSPEFDGKKLIRCVPAATGHDMTRLDPFPFGAKPCNLRKGSSGGGWIISDRYLVSVTSYGYCDPSKTPPLCGDGVYGPQLGQAAINLIRSASIGGTAAPTVKVLRRPPHRVKKHAVSFRVTGDGDTPIRQFKVRLDRKPAVITGPTIKIRKLSPGRHTLWIRSMDQTRNLSSKAVKRTFSVLPKKRKKPAKKPSRRP